MLKKQAQAEPQPAGMIAELRADVTRLSQALVSEPGSIYAQYEAFQNQLGALLQASADLSQPLDVDVEKEIRIAAIRRRLLALEPLLQAECKAREQANADYLAAVEALRNAETQARVWQQHLADFDRQTRLICAERDNWRRRKVAEMNRFIGGPTDYPPVLDLNTID